MTQGQSFSTVQTIVGLTDDEWHVARTARAHLLLVGPDAVVEKLVDMLRPDFWQPLEAWRPDSPLVLPAIGHAGTLILQDVGAMRGDDQAKLCDWLEDTKGRIRVVSTTRQPLFPLLEAGTFAEMLYYRLNILSFQITESDS